MRKTFRWFARQSPAMIVAMIALFVALSGTAVATTSALITGRQIANNSITGADIKNKSLSAQDIKGQLRGARGAAGPAGPAGAQGAQGAQGIQGPAGAPNPNAVNAENADKLDNLDSTAFASSSAEAFRVVGTAGQPGFTTCVGFFGNTTWSNFPGNFNTASFYKDPWGIVHVRGLVRTTSTTIPILAPGCMGNGTSVFVLPAGYRPAHEELVATVSNEAFGYTRVQTNGRVVAWSGSEAWFSLDGISFKAA